MHIGQDISQWMHGRSIFTFPWAKVYLVFIEGVALIGDLCVKGGVTVSPKLLKFVVASIFFSDILFKKTIVACGHQCNLQICPYFFDAFYC